MKPKRTAITLTTLLLLPLGAAPLSAATRTWDAGGATNDWNIAANWSANTAPAAGDSLVFPASVPGSPFSLLLLPSDKEMNNNIAVNTFFAGLTFTSSDYSLTGNVFDLNTGGIVLDYPSGTTTISPTVRLQGAGQSFDTGTSTAVLTLGALNLNGNSLTLTGKGRTVVGGNIVNTVGTSSTVILTKAGSGDVVLDGFNNFIATVEVTDGRLFANDFLAGSGPVNVRIGGILAGDGDIDKDVLVQGILAPGTLTDSTRPIAFTGNLSFSTNAANLRTLQMDVRSASPGTGYDQITAQANVSLNSASLVLDFGTFKPAVGTPLILINKTGAAAISGTFDGIAQGATLTLDGQRLQFSYTGGDGNDFTATPLNVLPAAGSLGLSTDEDTAVAVPLQVTDPNPQTLTYTIVSGPANGTVTGTAPNLTYTPDANFNGSDSFTWRVNDGVGNSNTATVSITVAAVNDAPTATNMDDTQVWREDTDEDLNDIVVTDVDDLNITVTLTLSKPQAGRLTTGTAGINASTYNATTGEWRASGFKSNVNALLKDVMFEPALNFDESFTIAVSVTDGDATISDTKIMGCQAINDAPTATNLSILEFYTEDNNKGLTNIVISDADDTDTTVTMTMPAAAGALIFVPAAGVTANYVEDATLGTFTASGPITEVNRVIGTLTYDPALNFHGNFSITTIVSDGDLSVSGSKSMIGTAVNDPPTATNLSTFEDYVEDTIEELTDIVVSDVDSGTITAMLRINPPAAGRLKEVSFGSVNSSFNATNGIWTASGSIADVNAVLAAVFFIPADNCNDDFDIITSISDGTTTIGGTKPVNGIPVNDVPTISVLPGRTIDEDDNTGPIAFTVNDPDGEVLTVDKSSSNIVLVPVSSIDINGTGSSRTVTVTPAANRFGEATITLTVSDATTTSPPSSFVLTVNSVNDAPVISPIADVSVRPGVSTGQIPFTATDVESSTLTIGKQTDNPGLVPLNNIDLLNGVGGRTVEVRPAGAATGVANITITANDGNAVTTRTFKVTVSALRPLEQWRQNQFGTTANSGDAADDFDFDRDGLTNLVEFSFGLDPKNSASSALPQPGLVDTNGDSIPDALGIHFTPPAGVSDIVFAAETSTTLQPGSWNPVPNTGTGPEKVFRIPLSGARGFMRLTVTPL